ncbi:MAG: hypothetical protein ACI9QD_000707 [Thermoproteota archaeon]|jgi:hypothetical protein
MKKLICILLLLGSFSALATESCSSKVKTYWQDFNDARGYDNFGIDANPIDLNKYINEAYNSDINFPVYESSDLSVYQGYSEYYSGYGIDAVVVENETCKIIDVVVIYVE